MGVGTRGRAEDSSGWLTLRRDILFFSEPRYASAHGEYGGFPGSSRVQLELRAVCEVEFGIRDFEVMHLFWKFAWHSTERLRNGSGE